MEKNLSWSLPYILLHRYSLFHHHQCGLRHEALWAAAQGPPPAEDLKRLRHEAL